MSVFNPVRLRGSYNVLMNSLRGPYNCPFLPDHTTVSIGPFTHNGH